MGELIRNELQDKNQITSAQISGKESGERVGIQLKDNRSKPLFKNMDFPQSKNTVGASLKDNRPKTLIQKKTNNTGLPQNLKSGVENLSGHAMDDVKVHYNSYQPAQLKAHAFAQGNQIHVAPGQEKHVPHEAWHVVQQKQGRVNPTSKINGTVAINDDKGLEKEADVMGAKAMQFKLAGLPRAGDQPNDTKSAGLGGVVQTVRKKGVPKKTPEWAQGTEVIFSRAAPPAPPRMDVIDAYLRSLAKASQVSFKHRKTGQRIEVHHSQNPNLKAMASGKKRKKAYVDPSYHDTVNYMNMEYGEFYDRAITVLRPNEVRIAYDRMLSSQSATVGPSAIATSSSAPLTTMTPSLMGMYHDSHYTRNLVEPDETQSTRHYEHDYGSQVTSSVPMSVWRPFLLPNESHGQEHTMVNAIGGSLDSNVPTAGRTIGQGKVYSTIYKHFQRTMEMLNLLIDQEHAESERDTPLDFLERTALHTKNLEGHLFDGMRDNEQDHFSEISGFRSLSEQMEAIDNLVILISASLDNVPKGPFTSDFAIHIDIGEMLRDSRTFVKKFEMLGAIIGLMIKKEKRLLLNYQLLGKSARTKGPLENLYELEMVEKKINVQVDHYWPQIYQELEDTKRKKEALKQKQLLE